MTPLNPPPPHTPQNGWKVQQSGVQCQSQSQSSELSWNDHIDYTVSRVNGVFWQLLRFKNLGASTEKLILINILKKRSILKFGSVCFHSSLSQELSHWLELQQKRSLAVILGSQYKSYRNALFLTSLPRLDFLREKATLNWAIQAQSNPLHSDMLLWIKAQLKQEDKINIKNIFGLQQGITTVMFPIWHAF